ncbi:uncharacterized protein LOC123553265 [Mercenaria mercenaria]|uniref:uncharacterized protein LOC123553265 n=1 Tax=Mercenaria mercenaria TaxID=6596 RepID=UPI00234F64B4|nr:uncharacterized protein LOC123553265 [Mercenaria mercenaria]
MLLPEIYLIYFSFILQHFSDKNIDMLILWCLSFLVTLQRTFAQAQVSGNAIDLANMNMNMMHMKCPLEPCQSVCLKKQPETGCFICDPKCNTGSSLVMPENGLPIHMQPINAGQTGFYSGCEHDNWMQCPVSCQRKFDQKGCFQCQCQSSGGFQASTKMVPLPVVTSSKPVLTSTHVKNEQTTRIFPSPSSPHSTHVATKRPPSTTQLTTENVSTKKSVSMATKTVFTSAATKLSQDDARQTKTQENQVQTQTPSYHSNNGNISTTISTDNEKTPGKQNMNSYKNNFKPNDLTFVLFGIMIVLLTFSVVFFVAWRKSSRKLKKNKDELYFVHKAYRQDSRAHLSHNEMMDPVYADISPRPEPPPRSPQSMGSTETSDGPIRSSSQSSETPLKEHFEDLKHDYLELI